MSDWEKKVQSLSDPSNTYIIKSYNGLYSCTCMSWRKQYSPIDKRTCKHLIEELGKDHEKGRACESFFGMTRVKKTGKKHKKWSRDIGPILMKTVKLSNKCNNVCHKDSKNVSNGNNVCNTYMGWYVSIKYNGAFARWTDNKLYTKNGNLIKVPEYITKRLPPDTTLDGELYSEEKQDITLVLSGGKWKKSILFLVFDIVDNTRPFSERYEILQKLQKKYKFSMVDYKRLESVDELNKLKRGVIKFKQEGLIFRNPLSVFDSSKRSDNVLKWKPIYNSYGIVNSIKENKVRNSVNITEHPTEHTIKHTIKHKNVKNTFNLSVSKKVNIQKGDKIKFKYSGRHENGTPEIATFVKKM